MYPLNDFRHKLFNLTWPGETFCVSPLRSRVAANGGYLRLLHTDTPGWPEGSSHRNNSKWQLGSCGCSQSVAQHRGWHLQQTLPGCTCQWWVDMCYIIQLLNWVFFKICLSTPRSSNTLLLSNSFIHSFINFLHFCSFCVQRRSWCWRFKSILTHGRLCWSNQTSTSSLIGFTRGTRQQRESLYCYDDL